MFGWLNRLFGKKPATGGVVKKPPPRLFGEGSPPPFVLPPSYPAYRTRDQNDAIRQAAKVRSHHTYFSDPGRSVDSSDDLIRMAIMTNLASDHSAHRGCDEHVKPADTSSSYSSSSDWSSSSPPDSSCSSSSSDSSCSSSSD